MDVHDDQVLPRETPFGPGWEAYAAARARFLEALGLSLTSPECSAEDVRKGDAGEDTAN